MRTGYYRLHDAPDSIPRPRRDAHGRALNLCKDSLVCKRGHGDEALAWVYDNAKIGASARWRCLACRNAVARACQKRRLAGAPRVRRDVVPAEALPPARGWTPRHPFDYTRVKLEAIWGPYAGWTRDQHRQHTLLLYRFLGWGPEAVHSVVLRQTPGEPHADLQADLPTAEAA